MVNLPFDFYMLINQIKNSWVYKYLYISYYIFSLIICNNSFNNISLDFSFIIETGFIIILLFRSS